MPGHVLLLSTYEMGHQPMALAAATAALNGAGHPVEAHDLSVESFSPAWLTDASLVAVSMPMHTAARLAIHLARTVRRESPGAYLVAYGLYAPTLEGLLRSDGLFDAVVGPEHEASLVAVADALRAGTRPADPPLSFARQRYPLPERRGLPGLDRYARLEIDGERRLAGYTEATRGCAHTCAHCPLTPVYGGRLRLVQPEIVLGDVEAQVAAGARHITFGDPDFLNAPSHALAVTEGLATRFPGTTFDFTAKVEHLLERAELLPRFRDRGCVFVTSAFESPSDRILALLDKGHTGDDLERVMAVTDSVGLPVRPTWMAFTPWTGADDYLGMLEFIDRHRLADLVQPVQYGLRLLLPPGSPLLDVLAAEGRPPQFDAEGLTHAWTSADERMDRLQREVAALVAGGCGCTEPGAVFTEVREVAWRALLGVSPPKPAGGTRRTVVGLTEDWFC